MDLSGLGGSTRGDEHRATQELIGRGISNPSSGLVRWVAHGAQDYGAEEGVRYSLPGAAAKMARDQANELNARRETFFQTQKGEEQDFLSRFRTDFPEILSQLEGGVTLGGQNLTQLRDTAFGLSNKLESLPGEIAAQAAGKNIGSDKLRQIIAAKQSEQLPALEKAIQAAQTGEQLFNQKAEQALVPYTTELDLLKDRWAREASGFGIQLEGELDLLLQELQNTGQLEVAKLNRATELAKLEAEKEKIKNSIDSIDLGNRVIIVDSTGKEVGTFDKGKLPGTSSTGTDTSQFFNKGTDLGTMWSQFNLLNQLTPKP